MRIRSLITLAALGLLSLSPLAAAPPIAPATPAWLSAAGLTADPDIRFAQLPNGMRVLIRRSATPPGSVSIRMRIDTGSLNETDRQRGVAHLLEHLVLNGTRNVPEGEFMRRSERLGLRPGADSNATTDLQQTVYRLDLPKNDPQTVDAALFLLREVADRATLEPAALDRVRGVVLAEERARFSPLQKAAQQVIAWHFRGQPIADRSPIGTIASIQTVPRSEVLSFYQAWYRPEKATLIIAGDIDPAALEARIRANFSDWKGEGPAGVAVDEGRPPQRGLDQTVVIDPDIPLGLTATWMRPADLRDSRARRLEDLRTGIVAAIFNRRLQRLAQQDTAPPFTAAAVRTNRIARSGSLTEIGIQSRDGDWRRALTAVNVEQRRLLRYGVTASEIAVVAGGIRSGLQTLARSSTTLPSRSYADLMLAQVNAGVLPISPAAQQSLFDELARDLTPASLRPAIDHLFAGSGPLLYLSSPRALPNGTPNPAEVWTTANAQPVSAPAELASVAWPYGPSRTPGQVVERKELTALGATSVRFANGVRLLVRPNKARDDQVLVRVGFGGGRLSLPAGKPSLEWAFGSTLIGGGTQALDMGEMQRALADKITALNFSAADDRFALTGATRTEDLATELQVMAAFMREPGWRPSGFAQARANVGRIVQATSATPAGVLGRDLGSLLLGGDTRYRLPPLPTMLETTGAQVRTALEPQLRDGPLEVVVTGDVTVADATRLVAETFGALPARPPLPATPSAAPTFPVPGKDITGLLHRGRSDQAMIAMAWPTVGLHGDLHQTRVLGLLALVLQQRMSDRLREQMGSTYVPIAQHVASKVWPSYGYLLAASETPADRLKDTRAAMRSLAVELGQGPIDPDELDRVRQPLLLNFDRERQTNEYWLGALADVFTDPDATRLITTRSDEYRAITPAELQAAARRYLLPSTLYEVDVLGIPDALRNGPPPPPPPPARVPVPVIPSPASPK